jgi:hypothetical protein
MFGAGALLATQRRRPVLAAVAALLCSLASPLAGLFLVLIGLAWAPSLGWRRTLPLAAAAAGVGGTALLGGGGGPFPFPWSSFVAILVFVGGGLALSRGAPAAIKRLLVIYAVAAVALFVVPNPVGGNLDRLGTDCAGPVAAVVLLANHRKRALAVAMPGLLFWQLGPVTGAVAAGASDPSTHAAYYAGLLDYLGRHNAPLGRLEIPLTRDHWETSYVARDYPLARGWERQLDLAYNPVFYQPDLTPQDYREWLLTTSVQYVALPDVALDPSSLAEAKILSARQPWLAPVWHDAHWRVWRVVGAEPLVGSGASLTSFGVDALTLRFAAPTTTEVRVHYNQFLRASGPAQACVARAGDGWTLVSTSAPGTVTVTAELRLPDLSGSTQYCTTPTR